MLQFDENCNTFVFFLIIYVYIIKMYIAYTMLINTLYYLIFLIKEIGINTIPTGETIV